MASLSLWSPYSADGGIRLVGSSALLQASFKVRKFRRSSGGGMPDSMGRNSTEGEASVKCNTKVLGVGVMSDIGAIE